MGDEAYNDMIQYYLTEIKKDIVSSGCNNIEFKHFINQIKGASLINGVIINETVLTENLPDLLYVIFHEIAHQFQYKKHGKNISFDILTKEINSPEDMDKSVQGLRNIEETADRFAILKCRKYAKLNLIDYDEIPSPIYKEFSNQDLAKQILMLKQQLKEQNIKSVEQMTEILFNWLIRKL